jgi:integrase
MLPTKDKRKRGAADVNHYLNCLRAILNKAIRWEMIEKNPAGGGNVERLPIPPGRNEYLSIDEAGRLLDACHPHIRPIVLCALETGMRSSEIKGLRWKEIRNGMIYLPGERTKSGKAREVPLSKRLSEELKRIRRQQVEGGVVDASGIVFKAHRGRPSENGTRRLKVLTTPVKSFRNAWKAAMEKAGIHPGFHFHDLRHTTASWLKMGGADDYTVMEILGHSDMKMMQRYAHLSPEHKRKAIDLLPEWAAEKTGPK